MDLSPERLRRRLVQFALRRLYHELAGAYDFVSRIVSRGRWRDWQRSALPYLNGPRVVELGCGTGDLILDLAEAGRRPIGVDASIQMLRVARRKLEVAGARQPVMLVQAHAQALPLLEGQAHSVVATFPTPYILDPAVHREIGRVLAPDGRLVVVNGGRLEESDRWSWILNRGFDLIGGRGLDRVAKTDFARLGFALEHRKLSLGPSTVWISLGQKPDP